MMKKKFLALTFFCLLLLFLSPLEPLKSSEAKRLHRPQQQQVTAYDLISAMNVLRMSMGNSGLIMDGTINAVAQSTAQIMADQNLSWHIGDVGGRLQAAGYGAGEKVFATENFAMGSDLSIDQVMVMWNDPDHMLPATNPHYCHVGAGVATAANGFTYYVLQAAYIAGKPCDGAYTPPGGGNPGGPGTGIVPGIITPVELAEMDENGIYTHLVMPGQSFWAIAVAYQVTIKDILAWNHLSEAYKLQIGDELIILSPKAEGYVPLPKLGAVEVSPPAADGSITHVVKPYENLSKIAEAYSVTVKRITELNGIKETTPLGIGWELIIAPSNHTPTPTERPLTPIERLTPAADGKYYHTVAEGQNLNWIANYYGVSLADLLSWNNLKETSVIYAGDKLLLNVTPPATITPTSTPVTPSPTATVTPKATNTPIPSATAMPAPVELKEQKKTKDFGVFKVLLPVMASIAVLVAIILFMRYKREQKQNT
jgi:LysM repeat protein